MKILLLMILLFLPYASFASTCVTTDSSGFVIATGESIDACTSMVLMSKDEYLSSSSLADILTMSKADYEQLSQAFFILLALSLVIKIVLRQLFPK